MNERDSLDDGCVVIGFESMTRQAAALSVAADEAQRRNLGLSIVTLLQPRPNPDLDILGWQREQHHVQADALQGLHEAAVSVRHRHPQTVVTTYCLTEDEVEPDCEPVSFAELLVVGTHGRHGRRGLSLESVSRLLLQASHCPVLVVPETVTPPPAEGPFGPRPVVVVGLSEHPSDRRMVQAAYDESAGRGSEVLLLHAYSRRDSETSAQAEERARALVNAVATKAPSGVRVSAVVTESDPAPALVGLASTASLLVIGGRPGALSGLVRGSVSRAVLEAASCPVLAVPRNLTMSATGSR
jgi:nucleotide-binding universal stress UspA family protein